ncbi:MAG: response regulator [Candidatus Promineifilaceae bacterium]
MATILVVEDDDLLRSTIVDVLDSVGTYKVVSAENGRIGLEKAVRYLPDLIVCDIEMPELDGYGLLKLVRENVNTATIPFIFLTALSDRMSTRTGMELGADDYITKPFTAEELLKAINSRFDKQKKLSAQYEQKIETLRGNIMMAVPHELRTPLGIIIGFSDLLVQDVQKMSRQEVAHFAKSINNAGHRLHRLVENYLVYAQLELLANNLDVVRQLRSRREAIPDNIIEAVVDRFVRNGHANIKMLLGAADVQLFMSQLYFDKIVDELLSNAVKFRDEGTEVMVKTAVYQNQFKLFVQNEGRGMTQEQISQIGPYIQFERRVYEQQGSGFGLAIANRLAELHNGRLTIHSVPNKTTTVQVTLPL